MLDRIRVAIVHGGVCKVLRGYLLTQMKPNQFTAKQVLFIYHRHTSKTLNTNKRGEVLQPQDGGEE